MEGLFLIGAIAVAVVAIVATRAHARKIERAWTAAATELGMSFRPGSFFKTGAIEGYLYDNRVEVDTFRKSTGKNSTTYTRFRVHYPEPLGLGLHLSRQGFLAGVASLFGAQDIEVGDIPFDREVVVKGADAGRVAGFLTPSRRLRILRLFQTYPDVEIDDHAISWSRRYTVTVAEELVSTVRRLAFTAARLRAEVESEQALDQAIGAQREGRLDEALRHVRQTSETGSAADPDARLLEGQLLAAGGRSEEAAEVFERASRDSPEDEELKQWARREPPEPRADASTPDPVAVAGLDVETVCDDLFAPDVLSLEASKRFDERYKESRVRWPGTLRKVSDYYIDFVFGNVPGTKLVLDVHEVASGAFVRTVQAIVQLPKEELDAFRSRVGEQLEFEGRLVSCDSLMRNLFIADGTVL